MISFIDALLNRITRTENGMATRATSSRATVDLFYTAGAMRSAGDERIVRTFSSAYAEDRLVALRLLFWARDVRGGAGERAFFRTCLRYLAVADPVALRANLHLVPEYGRWDDILVLLDTALAGDALALIATALRNGDRLCAKWMPRPGSARNSAANAIRRSMGLSPRDYRALLVANTDVVETPMCAGAWESIDYEAVPSLAMARYATAFNRRDSERFGLYKAQLARGEATINAGAVYPHDVVRTLLREPANRAIAEAQWSAIPSLSDAGDERILPVCDVSGSMMSAVAPNLTALDVCIALGLYISERNTGPYRDCFITFSAEPQLQRLRGSLYERCMQLQHADWGMNTDLHAVFDLILRQAVEHDLPAAEMPTRVLILSDMEFDACTRYDDGAIAMIERKYRHAGYTVPGAVFWNLQSRHANVPVRFDRRNVALVSGFSPHILAMAVGEIDPVGVMMRTVDSPRYSAVKLPETAETI